MFYFTQTSVKDLEKEETCPTRWKAQWLDGVIPFKSNEDMDKGKYFEYLALGAGANPEDQVVDMPRLKTGAKSTDQIRIEEQAKRFDSVLVDLGLTITHKQLTLTQLNRKGTVDFVAKDVDGYYWNIDLKLTADLSNDRTLYGWGNDWAKMDLIQTVHYSNLLRNYVEGPIRNGLLVFDYSPKKRIEFGEIIISDGKIAEYEARFKAAEDVVNTYLSKGWTTYPSQKECAGCPITCDKRFKEAPLVKKVINY